MEDCIFCKIISGDIPAKIVYQDDDVVIFKDVNPAAPVHILAVPRRHIATINDLVEEDSHLLGALILRLKAAAQEFPELKNSYRIIANCGRESGQSVFHIHLHLLGCRSMEWPPG